MEDLRFDRIMDEVEDFKTEIKASPVTEHANELIGVVRDSEKYFPSLLADLVEFRDPAHSLANYSEKDIALIEASLAKIELFYLNKIPRWREDEIRSALVAFENLRVYTRQHLSRGKKGHFLDKLTQISKIISYQANTPQQKQKRGLFGIFGR